MEWPLTINVLHFINFIHKQKLIFMKNRTDLVLIYLTVKLLFTWSLGLWTVFLKKGGLPSGKNSPGTSCKICWRSISVLKERNTIPICTRSILNVNNLDSRRVFSLFERETTTGLFVGKLNAIYQKYNIKVHKTQPYLQIYILNQNTGTLLAFFCKNIQV
jgi:hypothetical protein